MPVKIGIEVGNPVVTDSEINPGAEMPRSFPQGAAFGNTADHAALISGGFAGGRCKVFCCGACSLHPVMKADGLT